jgi:DNA-binding transcriptional LysR family regulator
MTLEQARCFVAVAHELHFGRAAERLQFTQPAVSRQIQALERSLGVELLARSSREVSLTQAGAAFLPEVERALQSAQDAATAARSAASGRSGRVRIGFTVLTALTHLGGWMTQLKNRLPDVDFPLEEMITLDQVNALEAGRIDLGVIRGLPYRRGIASEVVHREELVVATPRDHELANLESDPMLEQIAEFDMVELSSTKAPYLNGTVASLLRERNISARYPMVANQVHTALALVDAGLGAAIVPASAQRLELPNIVFRRIGDPDLPPTELRLAWNADDRSPAATAARDIILATAPR